MNRIKFKELLDKKILVLDGGYGTEFIKLGINLAPSDLLNINNQEVVKEVHSNYIKAGADIIITNTFNSNRIKLKALGCLNLLEELNYNGVKIAKEVAQDNALVFGDISSIGEFISPLGSLDIQEAIECFKEQALIQLKAGVDGFIIETMSDIKELKAAYYAIREITEELPIIAQMTFDEQCLSLTGTSAEIFATTFNDLDIDVIGINCNLGPDKMVNVLERLSKYTTKYLSIEPNAGEPVYDGSTLSYNVTPQEFGIYIEDYIELGANIIGGCCGTSYEHIQVIKHLIKNKKPINKSNNLESYLCSRTQITKLKPFFIIGERINPASKKTFQEQIVNLEFSYVIKEAINQANEGANVLDINLGIEKLLNSQHFKLVIQELDKISSIPLSFDIQNTEFLDIALLEYAGRPLINSSRVTDKDLEKYIKLLKKYGGMLILLAMDKQISQEPQRRFELIKQGIKILEQNGISQDRIIADPIIQSFGTGKDPYITLKTIELLSQDNILTTMGLSNLSFGLPDRAELNGVFLAQNIAKGLTSAILNTGDEFTMKCLKASLLLKGYEVLKPKVLNKEDKLIEFLLSGAKDELFNYINNELKALSPIEISQNILGKAMEQIGEMYAKKEIYLPHLLLASQTAEPIFNYLNSFLDKSDIKYKGKVLLATVEGDIHDIGKKIIGAVLKSAGFQIIDIGKDVPAKTILESVKKECPDILGLSAMMTTTVSKVQEVIDLLRSENINVPVITGGASMTENLAKMFGANRYCKDASTVVKVCSELIN